MSIFDGIQGIGDIFLTFFAIIIIIGGISSLIFILYGGVSLITSGGKDEKIKKAINTIRYAIYGIITIIASIYIFPILGGLLGLNISNYADPILIFGRVKEIGDIIFISSNELGYTSIEINKMIEGEINLDKNIYTDKNEIDIEKEYY